MKLAIFSHSTDLPNAYRVQKKYNMFLPEAYRFIHVQGLDLTLKI